MKAALALLAALLLWQALVHATGIPRFLLPAPSEIAQTLWLNRAMLAAHGLVTLSEMVAALICGAALGVALGLWLAWSPAALGAVRPILIFSQTIPIFTLAPLLTLWLGYGFASKLATGVLVVFFPVASAFLDALLRTPPDLLDLAKVMGARKHRLIWLIRLPAARPGLASGLRLAAVYAPIGAVLGEWVGASRGLGYLMLLANGSAKTPLMFAALVVLSALTFGLTRTVEVIARRLERV